MSLSDYVTTTQVAAAAGVTRRTVQHWIEAGKLPAQQIGTGPRSAYLITRTAAAAYIAARELCQPESVPGL